MSNGKTWGEARKLLCIRLDNMGDVLLTGPAIRALKTGGDGRKITLLTSPAGARVAELIPEVDDVIEYRAPWMKPPPSVGDSGADHAMIARLRRSRFDGAVIFTVYSQNPMPAAFMCYLGGIPLRLAHCRENPYHLLTHWIPDPEPQTLTRHEVSRQLDLVASIGCRAEDERMALCIPPGSVSRALSRLSSSGVDTARPWVLIHAGASAPSRRYPPEHFASVAEALYHETGYQVLFTGTEPERVLIEGVRSLLAVPSRSLAGKFELAELAALLSISPLLISNNTGPVHMASSVGTPVVDLYAQTNPQHTPWKVPYRVLYHDVPCKYCYKSVCPQGHHACLRLVEPKSVVRAAIELLDLAAARETLEAVYE